MRNTAAPPSVWISAGELSGDARAAEFAAALCAQRAAMLFGIAGPRLRALGVEPILEMEALQGIGIVEALRTAPTALAALRKAEQACRERRPKLAVLVDYGEFHLRLGKRLKRLGIPVFYLGPPKLWAWGEFRIARLKAAADRVGVLFGFEVAFYRSHGIDAMHVGHPAAAWLDYPRPAVRDKLLLLPGSRPSELNAHLAPLLAAVARLPRDFPLVPLLGLAPTLPKPKLPRSVGLRRITSPADFADGAVALAASGTVNLELAALGVAQAAIYVVHPLTYALGYALVRTPWLNPVNIAARAPVLPELRQDQVCGERLAAMAVALAANRSRHAARAEAVLRKLRRDDGMARAAAAAWELVR